jgi:TonB family protein
MANARVTPSADHSDDSPFGAPPLGSPAPVVPLRVATAPDGPDPDGLLSDVTITALQLTEATGAALALWRDGVVRCRARAGDMAPPLGARVNVESGISGECLRTGQSQVCADTFTDPLVEAEACRQLGIRSLAVVPLPDSNGVAGILEVFSDRAHAFHDEHVARLKHLAQIVVTHGGRSVETLAPSPTEPILAEPQPVPAPTLVALPEAVPATKWWSQWLHGDVSPASRLVAAAVLLLCVLTGLGWMLSTGRHRAARSGAASGGSVPTPVGVSSEPSDAGMYAPGSQPLAKPSPAKSDLAASEIVVHASKKLAVNPQPQAGLLAELPGGGDPVAQTPAEEIQPPEVSKVLAGAPASSGQVLASIGDTPVQMPAETVRTSSGVTGGRIVRQVTPVYPAWAQTQRIEGAVVLEVVIGEDGTVSQVTVLSGPPLLANAAQRAIQQWRYAPSELNGKPVPVRKQITIQFKRP